MTARGKYRSKAKIIIVENNHSVARTYELALAAEGYQVDIASTERHAIRALKDKTYHVALVDLTLTGDNTSQKGD